MKPHSASCSCTGCIYRSRSKEPNVQQAIQGGSQIDKLYYGKFLPLRERKLLEKLIKTRDVYDEVRNQLLSSASSDKIDHKKKRRDDSLPDKSSTVLKMVDLVDRGKMGSGYTSKLNSCCSCCSCETLRKIRRRMEKDKKKHPGPNCYRHIVNCEDIAKYCAEAEERGKKRRRKLSTQISSKIIPKVGAARMKIKKHLSEPLISSASMHASKAFMNKIRTKRKAKKTALARKVEAIDKETENIKVLRKPKKKVKKIQSSTTKESGTELKSPRVFKSPIAFKIKKDSIILFKEKLLKKRTYKENKDVECEPGTCEEDTCTPEECLRKIKAKGVGATRKRKSHSRFSDTGKDRSTVSVSLRTKKVKVREPQRSVSKSVLTKPRETYEKATKKLEKPPKVTKSASSMASLPKSKAKPQLTTTDEKTASKSKAKSDKGNIKCECKPSTKSTSSGASVPQKKVSKSVQKIMHELSHKKSSRKSLYNLDEANLKEPKEHVKATREKHEKPTHSRIKQPKKHRHGKMQSKVSQDSHLRGSVSQASKLYHGKSKHKESRSAESLVKKTKSISKEPPHKRVKESICVTSSHPDECRQQAAIKVSSSFSFGIEFHKDSFPHECCVCEEKVDKKIDRERTKSKKKIKHKEHRRKYKDFESGHTRLRPRPNIISTQSSSSQSSKNIHVGHKLKRCFCTLKLKDKKKKIKHAASKKTMASLQNIEAEIVRKKQTQTKLPGIAYVVPPVTAAKHVSRETSTAVTPKASAYTSQPVSKTTSKKLQSSENRKIKQKRRHSQSPNLESKVLSDTPRRQAKVASDKCKTRCGVRIGSSFSFGIECSKSNINCDNDNVLVSDKPKRRERKHLHQKGIKVHKPRVRHETSEISKDVKSKQTHTEPFLQRCLCTLKLMKKNKKKVENLSPWRNRNEYVMHMQNNTVPTDRAEIRYNHERSKILPYEHGAGVCIPKKFDPYCEKLTILRQMKLQPHKNITELGYQPTFSKTIFSSKSRHTQSLTRQSYKKVKKNNRDHNYISRSNLRVLQVASNLSNSVINKRTRNKDKINTIRQQFDLPTHYKSIDSQGSSKESSAFSMIKRIFSTSIFQKKRIQDGPENKTIKINERIKTYFPLPDLRCDYKSSRRRFSKLSYDFSGHECALNTRIPGICDSYKYYEDNKRRETKRSNNCYISTNKRERKLSTSITTTDFSGTSTSTKSTQSRLLKHKTSEDQNLRDKRKDLKPLAAFSSSHQSVRKRSSFSFNKDISKNRLVSVIQNTEYRESNRGIENQTKKYNTISEISTINTMPNKFRKEVKTSNVGFLLKRCLCTLGLQKKNLPKSEFSWQQPITTQFVQLEHNKNKININNVTNSGRNVLDNTLYGRQPLKSRLPEGVSLFRENRIGNQNGMKNAKHQHLPNSSTYPKQPHMRSSININFGKMRSLLNIQKINPFYKSFYALNVRISKTKNKSHDKYRAFNDNEYESNDCDPDECKKRKSVLKRIIKSELRHSKAEYKCCKPKIPRNSRPMGIKPEFKHSKAEFKCCKPMTPRIARRTGIKPEFKHSMSEMKCCKRMTHRIARPTSIKPEFKYGKAKPKTPIIISGPLVCCKRCSKESEKSMPQGLKGMSLLRKLKKQNSNLKSASCNCPRANGKDNNKVKFCTSVNCLLIEQARKRRKRCCGRGDGDGDSEQGTDSEETLRKEDGNGEKKDIKIKGNTIKEIKIIENTINDIKMKGNTIKEKIFSLFCRCKPIQRKGQGKKLRQKRSMETIRANKKICKELDRAEREMETIMPYSKKKFKKVDSRPKIATGKPESLAGKRVCDTCKTLGKSKETVKSKKEDTNIRDYKTTPERREKRERSEKGKFKERGNIKKPCCCKTPEDSRESRSMKKACCCKTPKERSDRGKKGDSHLTSGSLQKLCKCSSQARRGVRRENGEKVDSNTCCKKRKKKRRKKGIRYRDVEKKLCPVCKAKAADKFDRKTLTEPCTCMEEEKIEEPKKDTSLCPMCKDNYIENVSMCPCCEQPFEGKDGRALKMNKPLFKMTVNKTNMRIVNKDEVISKIGATAKAMQNAQRVKDLAQYHSSDCKCCICKLKGANAKVQLNLNAKPRKLNPCICGSAVCKKDWNELKRHEKNLELRRKLNIKRCICGSAICDEESQKMPELLLEAAQQAEHEQQLEKKKVKAEKLYQKQRKRRIKDHERSLRKQMKLLKKADRRQMKYIKKTENPSDLALVTESLLDLGTFGSKAFCDIAKYVYKSIRHPRDLVGDMEDFSRDPGREVTSSLQSAEAFGLSGTIDRIQERFTKMRTAKSIITKMEDHPASYYLAHIADQDPKKRMLAFKTKRKRVARPFQDFECSLYMASMRKRPCLRVYYLCPWFYPHCMSLIGLWKQFMDILMFICAILIWSPCIVCMELCRGCICCFMCQG